MIHTTILCLLAAAGPPPAAGAAHEAPPTLGYRGRMLLVSHPLLGAAPLKIDCMEAYCRKGSTQRRWELCASSSA